MLNGYIYLMDWGGFRGGYDDKTLQALADIGKKYKVNEVVIEGNFGDGMYVKLFSPVMTRTHRCAVTEVKSKGQKEMRICDVLEPVLGSHKLCVHESVIERDYQTALNPDGTTDVKYSGFYQLTRLTKERGSLLHDDRLDALAIGVQFFTESMEKDSEIGAQEMLADFLEEQMANPLHGYESAMSLTIGGNITMSWEDEASPGSFMGDWGR